MKIRQFRRSRRFLPEVMPELESEDVELLHRQRGKEEIMGLRTQSHDFPFWHQFLLSLLISSSLWINGTSSPTKKKN